MTRPRKPENMEEIDEEHRVAMVTNSDKLLLQLQKFHPNHDVPGIDDVKMMKPKKLGKSYSWVTNDH